MPSRFTGSTDRNEMCPSHDAAIERLWKLFVRRAFAVITTEKRSVCCNAGNASQFCRSATGFLSYSLRLEALFDSLSVPMDHKAVVDQ